jgi:hypothetical protein
MDENPPKKFNSPVVDPLIYVFKQLGTYQGSYIKYQLRYIISSQKHTLKNVKIWKLFQLLIWWTLLTFERMQTKDINTYFSSNLCK